jgi:hypothetical protein
MENIGQTWAKEVLEKGGREIMDNMNRKG